jgi:predicted TIM-barrel fold metal-dependent hydrolase
VILPGKQTTALLKRYINLGRFAFHKTQKSTFGQLSRQYPPGSGFIILPMDMEYMGAGKVAEDYTAQMQQLADLRDKNPDILYPFIFVDPRRLEKDANYFRYSVNGNGKVQLEECFIKNYIEQHKFRGFKIYPALGYYVFDEKLLPLWKYACENEIPILTHCIRGNIYYRGKKKKEWDTHPIFEQSKKEGEYEPLFLPEQKNIDFINNFTHPLNFLCLLDETLLRKVVLKAGAATKDLFGYTDEKTPLKYNLEKLKLCFGHYGGEDEWQRFFEKDRDNFSSQLVQNPARGIEFLLGVDGNLSPGKPEQVWKFADWYSITSSMMLQYDNVYSDISFILHTPQILPLLKQTMQNKKLKTRVLYGTDFYVVRNYKTDKNMLADMMLELSEPEFDLLARENPRDFLKNVLHGPVPI